MSSDISPAPPPTARGPLLLWLATFAVCLVGDALRARWLLLPLFVACFYAGMVTAEVLVYPRLEGWRAWLRPRGTWAWYAVLVGLIWPLASLIVIALSSRWLGWAWQGAAAVQFVGGALLGAGVALGAWTAAHMRWGEIMFTAALFAASRPPDQRLITSGPFRYTRNPLYLTDVLVLLGAALLTRRWALLALLAVYLVVLRGQVAGEERELLARFGEPYRRYRDAVPRFVPRAMSR